MIAGLCTDLYARARRSLSAGHVATGLDVAGVVTGLVTGLAGLLAFSTALSTDPEQARDQVIWHLGLALASVVLLAGVSWMRRRGWRELPSVGSLVVSLVAVGLLTAAGDLRGWPALGGPFDFFLDRGCYHAVRLEDPDGSFATLDQVLRPGALGLVLLGNDHEPEDDAGPPGVGEATIRREFDGLFEVLRLREFRFDARPGGRRYLGWSCLLQRRLARDAFPVWIDH